MIFSYLPFVETEIFQETPKLKRIFIQRLYIFLEQKHTLIAIKPSGHTIFPNLFHYLLGLWPRITGMGIGQNGPKMTLYCFGT
jgi:hypothetical protein